jgi:hypothetical protein
MSWMGTRDVGYLTQSLEHVGQGLVDAISSLIPLPVVEEIRIDGFLVDKNVLGQADGIIIEQRAEGVHDLCDGSGEERLVLGQLF